MNRFIRQTPSLVMAIIFFALYPWPARAQTMAAVTQKEVPDAQIVGHGSFTYLMWDLYDATLYAPKGKFTPNKPYALELNYKRDITGAQIVDATMKELARQKNSDPDLMQEWQQELLNIFRDVHDGTVLAGIYIPNAPTCFYQDEEPIGCMKDTRFGTPFFNIWLSPASSEPELQRELLGLPL